MGWSLGVAWVMFWVFLIVVAICAFVLVVVRMGIRHSENVHRMKHGFPPLGEKNPVDLRPDQRERLQ